MMKVEGRLVEKRRGSVGGEGEPERGLGQILSNYLMFFCENFRMKLMLMHG